MNFIQKRIAILIALTTGLCSLTSQTLAAPHLSIDLDTGKVLSRNQAFHPWHPASLTKLMTAYVAFRAIAQGEVKTDHPVMISDNARRQPPSKMGYRKGTVITLEDALKLLLVKSANDISVAIAEGIAGSVPNFSDRMNREAARIGMTASRFVNPHGLHDARQVTTARDLALLVRAIHREFPQYKSYFSTPSVMAPSITKNGKEIRRIYYSYNLLLERFRGGDGFKTGFVCASGYNFIGSATRSGRRIAAIVLGRDDQTSRAVDAAKLITQGFETTVSAGTDIAALAPQEAVPSSPPNLRNQMCSEQARVARYEPGAGQAVIESPWLLPRTVNQSPLVASFASRNAVALAAIPLPSFRPTGAIRTSLVEREDVEATAIPQAINTSEPGVVAEVAPSMAVGRVTVPSFRP